MSPAPKKADNYWSALMDAALEKDPPVILWRQKHNGVRVPVEVYDPHPDGVPNGQRAACKRGHEFTEANTISTPDGRQCRTCKNARRKPLTAEQKRRNAEAKREGRRRRQERSAA